MEAPPCQKRQNQYFNRHYVILTYTNIQVYTGVTTLPVLQCFGDHMHKLDSIEQAVT